MVRATSPRGNSLRSKSVDHREPPEWKSTRARGALRPHRAERGSVSDRHPKGRRQRYVEITIQLSRVLGRRCRPAHTARLSSGTIVFPCFFRPGTVFEVPPGLYAILTRLGQSSEDAPAQRSGAPERRGHARHGRPPLHRRTLRGQVPARRPRTRVSRLSGRRSKPPEESRTRFPYASSRSTRLQDDAP